MYPSTTTEAVPESSGYALSMSTREVIEAITPPTQLSARRALELLHSPSSELEKLAAALIAGLSGGEDDVLIDRPNRLMFATDASIYEMEPVAVV